MCSFVTLFSGPVQNLGGFRQICMGESRKLEKKFRPPTFRLCCCTQRSKKVSKLQCVIIYSKFSSNLYIPLFKCTATGTPVHEKR